MAVAKSIVDESTIKITAIKNKNIKIFYYDCTHYYLI